MNHQRRESLSSCSRETPWSSNWQLLELGKAYLSLNPIAVYDPSAPAPTRVISFLDTLRPPVASRFTPTTYQTDLSARLQEGTPQMREWLNKASSPEERQEMLKLATNLLKATQIAATGTAGQVLREHSREPEYLKEVVDLAGNYVPQNAVGDAPDTFFLETLLSAEDNDALAQGAAQMRAFVQGQAGSRRIDPTQLLEMSNGLLTVVDRASDDLAQVQEKAFFAELLGTGRTYLGLRPQTSSEGEPLNFYLDTLLKDQQERAEQWEQSEATQGLREREAAVRQQREEAIAAAADQIKPFLQSLNPSYDLSQPEQRTQLMQFGQNLLEVAGQTLHPQRRNPQFLEGLLEFGTLYDALREELPAETPHSFLYSLWKEPQIDSNTGIKAQAFFRELASPNLSADATLFGLRLLTANEHRVTLPQPGNQPASLPDLTMQLAQLAKAYAALEPDKNVAVANSFLHSSWISEMSVNLLGTPNSLESMQQAAAQLQTFLVGDQLLKGFKPAEQSKVLEFTTKLLKAAAITDQLAENQKRNPALLQTAFIDASRNFARIRLQTPADAIIPDGFNTLWNASVEDAAAVRQGVVELEAYLGENGLSIESMEEVSKLLLAIDLAIDKLGENHPVVAEMLKGFGVLFGMGLTIVAALKIPALAAVSGVVALLGAVFDAYIVGYRGSQSVQQLMEFYIQAVTATDAEGIDQAATTLVEAMDEIGEFAGAVVSLLTIGQSGWDEMKDALQDLLGFLRLVADRAGSILIIPVLESIRTLFRYAQDSATGAASAIREFLKKGKRFLHLFEILVHLIGKTDVFKALAQSSKILNEILNTDTADAKKLIDALGQSISHFGNIADGVRVIETAIDAKVDLVSLERLLHLASSNSGTARWNDPSAIVYFFTHIADAINELTTTPKPGVPIPTWPGAVDALDTFNRVHIGSIPSGSGSISNVVQSTNLTLPNGSAIQVDLTEERLFHFLTRHTYEEFAFSPRNSFTGNRISTLWTSGYTRTQILQDAQSVLQTSVVRQSIETAITNGQPGPVEITGVVVGNWQYTIRVALPTPPATTYQLIQMFPQSGIPTHRNVLRGLAEILGK
jgi:hypothetical protein